MSFYTPEYTRLMLNYFRLFLLLATFSLSSCDSNPAGITQGTISGFIELIDEESLTQQNHAGVTVSLIELDRSTVSDADGTYTFDGIPAGYYTLVFKKEGYSEDRIPVEFLGTGTYHIGRRKLWQYPDFTVDDIDIEVNPDDSNQALVTVALSAGKLTPEQSFSVTVFFSKKGKLSLPLSETQYAGSIDAGALESTRVMWLDRLRSNGVQSGETVVLTFSPANVQRVVVWYFDNEKRIRYTDTPRLDRSKSVTFTMP